MECGVNETSPSLELDADLQVSTSEKGSLSPINEIDEHVLNESSFLAETENENGSLVDETLYRTSLDLSNITLTGDEQLDLSDKQPKTPPEVLRERLSCLRTDYEYLVSEHEELVEYTQLEKQICHSECVSKETIQKQENLLESLSCSIESLKNENQNLHKSLCQKNSEIKIFEENLATMIEANTNMSNIILSKLSLILKDGCKEMVQNTSAFDNLQNNNDGDKKYEKTILNVNADTTSGTNAKRLLNLVDSVVKHHFETESRLKQAKLEQQKLHLEKEAIYVKMDKQQKQLSFLNTENLQLQDTVNYFKTQLDELTTTQLYKNIEHDNLKCNLNKEIKHIGQLKKLIENTVTLEIVQDELQVIFHELCNCLEGVNCIKDLQTCISSLSSNTNLVPSVNLIMNDSSQKALCKFLDKVDEILRICNAEWKTTKPDLSSSNHRIALLEKDTNHLKYLISDLKLEVTEHLDAKVCTLEKTFESKEIMHENEQLNLENMEKEVIVLKKVVSELKVKLKVKEDQNESLRKSILEFNQNVCRLQSEIHRLKETLSRTEKESCDYCLEELKNLREQIATEVENLDLEDTKDDLLNYSSTDIFTKLMQNIINKETEFKEDLEKRYQEDLQKAKQDVEESKNKRKSQEFWVIELQNENEEINKELTILKGVKNELDKKIKMLFTDLKTADLEISMLKCKQTELIVEKDTLLSEVSSLKECLEVEKDKCANLEKISTEHSKFMSSLMPKKDNLERKETLFNTTKCDKNLFHEDIVKAEHGSDYSSISKYANCDSPQKQHNFSNTQNNTINLESNLENERDFLTEVINDIDNDCFGGTLLANVDQLTLSRDIVKLLSERFLKIEKQYTSNLAEFQNDLDNLKSSIVTLYKCISTDDFVFDEISPGFSNGFTVMVGNELKFVKDECIHISNTSRDIEQTAKYGQMFIQKLREEFYKVKRDIFEKVSLVQKLEKTVLNERSKVLEQEEEAKHVKTKLNTTMLENSDLQEQVSQLAIQLSKANEQISSLGVDFPASMNVLESKLHFLVETYKKEIHTLINKCEENREDANFFAYHLGHVLPHLHQLEMKSTAAHKVSKAQCWEVKNLKQTLLSKEKELDESNLSLKQILSALPGTVLAPQQAVKMINHVFSVLRQSEEEINRLSQELAIKNETISVQLQDLNSTNKLNSNLKLQLTEYEEQIRRLRSELRSLGLKSQRKQIENNKPSSTNKSTIDIEVQTGIPCCKHVEDNIDLHKRVESQGSTITDLTLKIQQGGFLYEEKVKQLECSLRHAKERIGTLNQQLTQQKNFVKDLVQQQRLLGAFSDNSPQESI